MTDKKLEPVTESEAEFLHEQGWNSGFGWQHDLDWWKEPSYGPRIRITDSSKYMAQWLDDRADYERLRVNVRAQFFAAGLLTALDNIAHEAGEYADGAEDSHYLAKVMCNIEAIARSAVAPVYRKGEASD